MVLCQVQDLQNQTRRQRVLLQVKDEKKKDDDIVDADFEVVDDEEKISRNFIEYYTVYFA